MRRLLPVPLVIVAIALTVGLLFIGCAKPAPQQGPKEILFGCPTSLTGMYGSFGDQGSFGEKVAIEDINKQGGVDVKDLGRKLPIKLILTDDESDPQKAGALAQSMILSDKVNFLVCPNLPPTMHPAVAKIAQEYKIPHVTGIAVIEPWLGLRSGASPAWNYTWGTGFAIATPAPPGDFRSGPGYTILDTWFAVLDTVLDQTNKKAAVFASNDPDGVGWYDLFGKALAEHKGIQVIGLDKQLGLFPFETTDYSSMINEWKNANCDILWGNCPSPNFATLWRQAHTMGYHPKLAWVGRAPLYYTDVLSWGGDLPNGVCVESFWDPAIKNCVGIGSTTPQSLYDQWIKEKKYPPNFGMAWGYSPVQIIVDAINRAGSLDADKVNQALSQTDLMTMFHRVKYDENQISRIPVVFSQWFNTDTPLQWEQKIIFSQHDFLPATAKFMFPLP
jgi:branched-chain amino acid transport system substrate-binding protein